MAVEFWKHPVAATVIRCFKSQIRPSRSAYDPDNDTDHHLLEGLGKGRPLAISLIQTLA